jgi:phosphotransferase family enzyme
MGHTISVRNSPAVQAAQEIARRHGIAAEQVRVLHDANNVVVHLAPSPVVAKICRASRGDHGWRKLATELEIARHLIRAGAPVVGPSLELPPGPHVQGDFAMTFWRYQEHDPDALATCRGAGHALAQVHEALDSYPETFPSFLDRQVRRTARILFGESATSLLPTSDRDFLCSQYLSITSALHERKLSYRTLHGDPHRGNVLVSEAGYLLIDFESVCSGPLEWDLSALPGLGAGAFDVDEDLLSLLRRLRSLCVAVWCWARARSSTTLDRAARNHMGLLRLAAEPCLSSNVTASTT